MTDNTYRFFTPTDSDTFNAGWYLLDDNGMRQGNVPSAAFGGADTMIIDSNTPTSSPLTAGADNDVYLVTADAPRGLVEISDDIGTNTIRFEAGVDIVLFTFQYPEIFGVVSKQVVINTTAGTSIQLTTPDSFVFEFADTNHALHGLSLTAQQLVDYVAGNPIFEAASYTVDAAENIADDAAILTLSGRDKTTASGDLTYTLKAASDIFEISTAGVISLKDGVSLDFETATNSYDLVVVISDGTNTTEANVTINVTNVDEGAATFTIDGTPKVGVALTADKATDDADGNGTFTYQWYTDDSGTEADIAGATDAIYTPVAADAGKTIGVRVTYTDGAGKSEVVKTLSTAVVAPADIAGGLTLDLAQDAFTLDGTSGFGALPDLTIATFGGVADLSTVRATLSYTDAAGNTQTLDIVLLADLTYNNGNPPSYFDTTFEPIKNAQGDIILPFATTFMGFDNQGATPSVATLLPAGTSQDFTITVTDGTATVTKTISVIVTGVDDPISEGTGIGILDANGVVVSLDPAERIFNLGEDALEASATPITKTGILTINDPDISDAYTLNVSFALTESGSSDAEGLPSDTSATLTLVDGETKTLNTILGQIEVTLNGKTITWLYTYSDDIGQYGANGILTETVTIEAVDILTDASESKGSVDLVFNFDQSPEIVEFFDVTGASLTEVTGQVDPNTVTVGEVVASVYILSQSDPSTDLAAGKLNIPAGGDFNNFDAVIKPTMVTINGKQYHQVDITWTGDGNDAEVAIGGQTDNHYDFDLQVGNFNTSDATKTIHVKLAIATSVTNTAPTITSDHSTAIVLPDGYYDTVSQIAKVKATDVDVGDTLIFNIIAGNDEDLFEIDANGVITMVANDKFLVYNAKPLHNLTIEVSDGNGGVANTTVTINVAEVNFAPEFAGQSPYYGTLREDADINSAITLNHPIYASDANSDGLEYIILGGFDAPLFKLSDDNEIVLIGNLDFETKQTLSLRIAVTDGSAWDAISVDIYVKDVDEAPEFINEGPITILVAEDYTNDDGMPITTITATDPENGMLEYFINGDDDGLFTINDRGQITLSEGKSLDYETATSHMFIVEVFDPESNSNKIEVMINVDDVIEDIVPEPVLSADIV